ncbi:MAG: hypothetical protein Aurels2KO_56840 [Aureliella sp.]
MSRRIDQITLPHKARKREEIASELFQHQLAEHEWTYSDVTAELHRFREIFDFEFKLRTDVPVIKIARLRGRRRGHYLASHNGFGLEHEIALDERHLLIGLASDTSWSECLATLLHEMIHLWEALTHGRRGALGNYHTRRFRDKAEGLGLLVSDRGEALGILPESPFTEVLKRHGIRIPEVDLDVVTCKSPAETKLRKWTCRCGINARIAVTDVPWRCDRCGSPVLKTG